MKQKAVLLSVVCCAAIFSMFVVLHKPNWVSGITDIHRKLQEAPPPVAHHHRCPSVKFIPPIKSRDHLGEILKLEKFKIGAELGVQTGEFSKVILEKWQVCEKYVMVDVWAHISSNYADMANVDDEKQNKLYAQSMGVLDDMKKKGYLNEGLACRNFTSNCFQNYPDHHFDFIYVDASHNYKVLVFSRFFIFFYFFPHTHLYFIVGRSAGSSSVVAKAEIWWNYGGT